MFSVPALITGTYSVTVSLQGFKRIVIDNVIINSGVPVNVRATLGARRGDRDGDGASQLRSRADADGHGGHDARHASGAEPALGQPRRLAVHRLLPGVSTPDTTRNSSVNGMPQTAINMTLDGVNIQDNTLKSTDGFFAIVGPRSMRSRRLPSSRPRAVPKRSAAARRRSATRRVGNEPVLRLGLSPVPQRRAEREHVVQQARWAAQARTAAEPAGLQCRRSDHASGLRRPQSRVLLLQLRGTAAAVRIAAQPPDIPPGCDAGHLPLQHDRRRRVDGESVRACRAQRPAGDARSDRREAARRYPQRHGERRQHARSGRSAVSAVFAERARPSR